MKENTATDRLTRFARIEPDAVDARIGTPPDGLSEEMIRQRRNAYGENTVRNQPKDTVLFRLRRAFINPFSVVLSILALISLITDVILSTNATRNDMTFVIICSMILLSGTIRFVQELRAKRITEHLIGLTNYKVTVKRSGDWRKVDVSELVVGDRIRLEPGDPVPADIRLTAAENCFVSQSAITGESELQCKKADADPALRHRVTDFSNLLLQGTTVISGDCTGIVLAVGDQTVYGRISAGPSDRKDGFNRGANAIAWVLIRFMVILIPVVFIAGGLTRGDWISAFLFALSVAVGLTPELLPMVITACMVRGSSGMEKKQTVVKNINAMQSFGCMDVLCVDKTGTLTGDRLILEYYMDLLGNESFEVLDLAYLNSALHSGTPNHLDRAILHVQQMPGQQAHFTDLSASCRKLAEIPFDDTRRISSVLLEQGGQNLMITKGDPMEVCARCTQIYCRGQLMPMQKEEGFSSVHAIIDEMLEDGMKVLGVAVRRTDAATLSTREETGLIFVGYLAFFDVPKSSSAEAIRKLKALNVDIRVLTGDHASVTASICRRLGIGCTSVLTGEALSALSDNELQVAVERTTIFAELNPKQKALVIRTLQSNGHSVGFLGDGMNDLPAILDADVGISVDTATSAVQDAADVILLKKDLGVLEEGILEGRRAFANMEKYIKITASSNLGNIISIVCASILLPFFPMTSVQLLLLNLLYDLLCLILPWDRVDPELCEHPMEWSGRNLSRFMLYFGSISSVFDLITFAFLFYVLCPAVCGGPFGMLSAPAQLQFVSVFQTGWFLDSMWTQVLILHLLRTPQIPFLQSRPSTAVLAVTVLGISALTVLAMSPVGHLIGLSGLPPAYLLFLALTVGCYLLTVSIAKQIYLRKYRKLF